MDIIHEIDLALWLLGDMSEAYGDLSNISDQKIEAEDIANIILKTKSGAIGQLQLDLLSPILRRGLEIVTKDSIYSWDYSIGDLFQSTKRSKECIFKIKSSFDRNDMFLKTMQNFIKHVMFSTLLLVLNKTLKEKCFF